MLISFVVRYLLFHYRVVGYENSGDKIKRGLQNRGNQAFGGIYEI
jgi:hypothetical protein